MDTDLDSFGDARIPKEAKSPNTKKRSSHSRCHCKEKYYYLEYPNQHHSINAQDWAYFKYVDSWCATCLICLGKAPAMI